MAARSSATSGAGLGGAASAPTPLQPVTARNGRLATVAASTARRDLSAVGPGATGPPASVRGCAVPAVAAPPARVPAVAAPPARVPAIAVPAVAPPPAAVPAGTAPAGPEPVVTDSSRPPAAGTPRRHPSMSLPVPLCWLASQPNQPRQDAPGADGHDRVPDPR